MTQPNRQGFLHLLVTDYRALASLVGLLVYGVVRVAYDAYYTRLGVFPGASRWGGQSSASSSPSSSR